MPISAYWYLSTCVEIRLLGQIFSFDRYFTAMVLLESLIARRILGKGRTSTTTKLRNPDTNLKPDAVSLNEERGACDFKISDAFVKTGWQ